MKHGVEDKGKISIVSGCRLVLLRPGALECRPGQMAGDSCFSDARAICNVNGTRHQKGIGVRGG